MGACLCKGHKVSVHLSLCLSLRPKLESTPTVPGTELQPNTEGQPIIKDDHRPANGTLTNSKSRSNYNIGELATSSLLGLVATIKEHITKPTAMAQGRVAHLIEWKGWASGGGAAYSSAMWGGTMGSWAGAGTGLQEDQQLYSDLTDEIKEARFAAGVAQQFALAEATLGAWSFQDIPDGSNSSCAPLQDSDGILLSQYVFSAGDVGAPQHCYSGESGSVFPLMPAHSQSLGTCWQPDVELQPQDQGTSHLDDSIRHADSSSLSEDEVFYD